MNNSFRPRENFHNFQKYGGRLALRSNSARFLSSTPRLKVHAVSHELRMMSHHIVSRGYAKSGNELVGTTVRATNTSFKSRTLSGHGGHSARSRQGVLSRSLACHEWFACKGRERKISILLQPRVVAKKKKSVPVFLIKFVAFLNPLSPLRRKVVQTLGSTLLFPSFPLLYFFFLMIIGTAFFSIYT